MLCPPHAPASANAGRMIAVLLQISLQRQYAKSYCTAAHFRMLIWSLHLSLLTIQRPELQPRIRHEQFLKKNINSASQELKTCNRLCNIALSELTNHTKGCLLEHVIYEVVIELLNVKIHTEVKKRVVKIPKMPPEDCYTCFFADPSRRE